MKQLFYFFIMFVIIGFMSCSTAKPPINNNITKSEIVKPEPYNTTTLLFYSNHYKKVIEKAIKIPKETPSNFTKTMEYSKMFPWSKYVCEIRFSESKNSLPFYSIFAFYNYNKVLAIARVNSIDLTKRLKEQSLFWVYDKNGNPIRATIKEFKKALEVIEIKLTEPV